MVLLECDPIDDAPILDLRIRKGSRRRHVRLAIASARPTALDARADRVERIAPGGGAAWLASLEDDFVDAIASAGEDVVIVYGERLLSGPHREVAAKALLNLAARLGLAGRDGAGLLEIPATAPGSRRWPSPAGAPPRSPRGSPRRSSTRSTCCTPTRCAGCPTATGGSARWAPPRS